MKPSLSSLWEKSIFPAPPETKLDEQPVRVGDWSLRINQRGLLIEHKGVPVWRGASFWIVSPNWVEHYAALAYMDTYLMQPWEDGVVITAYDSKARQDVFGVYRVGLSGDRVVIELLHQNHLEEELLAENAAAYLAGELLAGQTTNGRDVPQKAVSRDEFTVTGKQLELNTRIGTIQVTSSAPLRLFDARKESFGNGTPVFWLGCEVPVPPGISSQQVEFKCGFGRQGVATSPVDVGAIPAAQTLKPESPVVPMPQECCWRSDQFTVPSGARIYYSGGSRAVELAVSDVVEKAGERYGLQLISTAVDGQLPSTTGAITLRRSQSGEQSLPAEGYRLRITGDGIEITGEDDAGLVWGLQTLLQLLGEYGPSLPGVEIRDWPDFPVRALHIMADHKALQVHKETIDRLMIPHKLNCIVLEAEHVEWSATRNIHQDWFMSKDDLRTLVQYANERGITVVPLIQALGHMEWFFHGGKNLEMAEDPETPYAVNPNHPKVREILLSVCQEAVDICRAKYLHIGHDEVTMRGRFPHREENVGKSLQELVAGSVRYLHEHFAPQGVRLMMWSDMLLGPGEGQSAHAPTKELAKKMRDMIPKDVIMADWHYTGTEFPSLEVLSADGFDCIGCTWKDEENIAAFSRAGKRQGIMGMMDTSWIGYQTPSDGPRQFPEQYRSYILQAEYAWSADKPELSRMRRPLDVVYEAFGTRPDVEGADSQWAIDLSPAANGFWLPQLEKGSFRLADFAFNLQDGVGTFSALHERTFPRASAGLDVREGFDGLVFLHATSFPAYPGEVVGYYDIELSGDQISIPLVYGENICAYTDPRPVPDAFGVWQGEDEFGRTIGLYGFVWENKTARDILSVRLRTASETAAPFLLGLTGLRSALED